MKLLFCKPKMVNYWQFQWFNLMGKNLMNVHHNANCGSVIGDFKRIFTVLFHG